MEKDKQQPSEERTNQRIVPERVNLSEYAGDGEDTQLACQQANEYLEDCDRKIIVHRDRDESRSPGR